MKFNHCILSAVLACALVLGACSPSLTPSAAQMPASEIQSASSAAQDKGTRILRVVTHDSFDVSEEVLQIFRQKNNVEVQFIKAGDTGTSLNKVILSKDNPIGDVFYGVDNTFLGRALEQDVFDPFSSNAIQSIIPELQPEKDTRAIPIDYGDVCLNYDVDYLKSKNLTPPQSLDDLTKPDYNSLLVVQNPAMSSPGLSFLLTTIGVYGDPGYLEYWKKLVANETKIVNDWEAAYYTEFTPYGGTRPLVVSYSSSPAYEVLGAEKKPESPPTQAVIADDTCFRQIEYAGILKETPQKELAQAWLEFMLSPEFQADIPGKMYMLPVVENVKLDAEFEALLQRPRKTVTLDAQDIDQHRQEWLKTWTETILR